jgi:hypothetical protein
MIKGKENKRMTITNKDIEKMKEVFVTKEDFDKKLDDKFKEVLSGQDRIIKELETARQDRILAVGKDRDQDRGIEDLKGRVKRVEDKVLV